MRNVKEFEGKRVLVLSLDGRFLVGDLVGYDRVSNIVLNNCIERIFGEEEGYVEEELGLYVIRGDAV